jgi:hypothetical protein
MTYNSKTEKIAAKRYSGLKQRFLDDEFPKWEKGNFIKWYQAQTNNCFYCKLPQRKLYQFYKLTKSKRYGKRGRTLEIDRKKDTPYSEDNCCLCCYWCNNAKSDVFSEGISLNSGKVKLAELGLVKRVVLKEFGIKQEVLFADFNWENVLKLAGKSTIKVSELPKFPSVKRDFALLLDKEITFGELYNLAFQAEKNLLKEVDLFDVYEGENLEAGKKSYAVSFLLQDETKTLTDVQIDKVMQKLQLTFEKNVGATLR